MKDFSSHISFRSVSLSLVLIGFIGLSSCGVFPTTPSGQTLTHGLAHIEYIEVFILESFPVQVHIHIAGLLQDSCTTRDEITQRRIGNTFLIRVTTIRPAEAICADVVSRFEEQVALDVYGLPAGTYGVDVNGVQETFTLAVDNVIQSELK